MMFASGGLLKKKKKKTGACSTTTRNIAPHDFTAPMCQFRARRVMQDIRAAGRAGRIRATGTCTRTNERREIQAIEWQDLEYVEAGERDALRYLRCKRKKAVLSQGYDDIFFFRDEILKEWPLTDGDSTRLTREPEAAKKRRAGRRLGSTDFDWGRARCLPSNCSKKTAILPMMRIGLMAGKTKPILRGR